MLWLNDRRITLLYYRWSKDDIWPIPLKYYCNNVDVDMYVCPLFARIYSYIILFQRWSRLKGGVCGRNFSTLRYERESKVSEKPQFACVQFESVCIRHFQRIKRLNCLILFHFLVFIEFLFMHSVYFQMADLLKCTICSASYSTRATLKRHHESATDVAHRSVPITAKNEKIDSGARQFHCEWCTNIELNAVSLRKHQIELIVNNTSNDSNRWRFQFRLIYVSSFILLTEQQVAFYCDKLLPNHPTYLSHLRSERCRIDWTNRSNRKWNIRRFARIYEYRMQFNLCQYPAKNDAAITICKLCTVLAVWRHVHRLLPLQLLLLMLASFRQNWTTFVHHFSRFVWSFSTISTVVSGERVWFGSYMCSILFETSHTWIGLLASTIERFRKRAAAWAFGRRTRYCLDYEGISRYVIE